MSSAIQILLAVAASGLLLMLLPYAAKMRGPVDQVRTALGPELHGKWSLRCVQLRAEGKSIAHMFEPPYYGLEPELFKQ